MRIVTTLLALTLGALAGEPPGDYYANKAWGFKLRVPRDWRQAAVRGETPWLCAKYLGKRELEGRLEDRDWMTTEAPEMWVIGFPHGENAKVRNPYETYRDYITRDSGFTGGGTYEFVQDGKQATVAGGKVSIFKLRLGKKKRIGRRIVAYVFHFDDIDFAVQFKVLEWNYHDYKASFSGCMKSFRRIKRTKALVGGESTGGEKRIQSRGELRRLPEDERARAHRDAVEAAFARTVEAAPKDWRHERESRFLVLTNADKKFVRATAHHTNAVLGHFDKMFGKSDRAYTPPFLLRIFATEEQQRAYGEANATGDLTQDIAIYSGKGWVKDNSWEILNKALWSRWLQERHPQLKATLPAWIKEGFDKYMTMVRSKGRKITFFHGDYDRDEMRLQIKAEKYDSLLSIMSEGSQGESAASMSGYERERQIRTVVLWLMQQGNKGKRKNLIRDYVLHVAGALDDAEREFDTENAKKKKAERGVYVADGDAILRDAWNRSFGKWKEKDWKKLTTVWLSFAK